LRHAETLLDGGADILDIGGESTRPGAERVATVDEIERVVPVISEVRRRRADSIISVDTSKRVVAEAALEAGADLVNDVSAASDDGILHLVAKYGAGIALMHRRGNPTTMQDDTSYDDVVAEVYDYLRDRAALALRAGIPKHLVWLDPGVGFGKDVEGNLKILAALPDLAKLGHPVLIGPSRKSFIGNLTGAPVDDRMPGSLAALIPALGIERAVVRVHDPVEVVQFLEIATRIGESTS
jgi:dihydropteroate synthase